MSLIDPLPLVLGGLLVGFVFGFLLHRGGVANYPVIVGQFLWVDHTVLKVMLTAIVVGAVGVYGMLGLGWIEGLLVKPAVLAANLAGGLVFGVGMVGLGYCPGTGCAAAASGSRHAWFGLLGMVFGAAVFTQTFPWVERTFLSTLDLGKVTLAEVSGVDPWVWIAGLVALAAVLFTYAEWADPSGARIRAASGPR
jgi:uncharacterized protein